MRIPKARYLLPVLMAGLLYLFFTTYRTVRQRAIDDFNAQQLMIARQAASSIESFFSFYQQELTFLTRIPVVVEMDARGRALLDIFYQNHASEIKAITRMDSSGRILYSTPPSPGAIGRDISHQPHVQILLKERRPVVSDVFTSVQGYSAVAFLIPVFQNEVFQGSLTVLIPFDAMASRFLHNIRIGQNGYAWMISQSGILLFHPVANLIGRLVDDVAGSFPALRTLSHQMLKGGEGDGDYMFSVPDFYEGRRVDKHAVYTPVRLAGALWSIAVATPSREVDTTLVGFRNRMGFIALLFIGVSLYFFATLIKTRAVLAEVKKRQQVENALRETEQRFQSYVEHSPVGIFVTDPKGFYVDVNPAACLLTGYDQAELLKMNLMDYVVPEWKPAAVRHFQMATEQGYAMGEVEIQRKEGARRFWMVTAMKLTATRFLGFVDDITERRRAETEIRQNLREKEVLLKEIHHRVKNNMNVITSLLSLQAREIHGEDQAVAALNESIQRVRSMALVHEKLYQVSDLSKIPFREYIETLVQELLTIHDAQNRISVNYQVEPLKLSINLAIPCGLILNELITNALKHAFPQLDRGHIGVALATTEAGYRLTVSDDGKGMPESVDIASAESLGLHLVHILIEQLVGQFVINRAQGTEIQITFPDETHE